MTLPTDKSYALPAEQMERMIAFARHLSERDATSPLKRRMRTFLVEANRGEIREP